MGEKRREEKRAEDRARTGHPNLGKVVLYQMSYFRLKNFLFGARR